MNYLLFFQTWDNERMAAEQANADWGWTTNLLPVAYVLIGLAAVIALVWSIINMIKNPAGLKNFLIGLIGLAVLAGIGWVLSTGTVPNELEGMVNSSTYHMIGTGIWLTGILIGIGLLILVIDLVRGLFKF